MLLDRGLSAETNEGDSKMVYRDQAIINRTPYEG